VIVLVKGKETMSEFYDFPAEDIKVDYLHSEGG